jgi:hypothetical protein
LWFWSAFPDPTTPVFTRAVTRTGVADDPRRPRTVRGVTVRACVREHRRPLAREVVDEKSRVIDVRAVTVIDVIYAVILFVFNTYSTIPTSTTWVFVGLLAGREIAMASIGRTRAASAPRSAWRARILFVTIGLVVSVALALASNDAFMTELFG